ncbi:four helix bundle protein [Halanaerocella petrolearia]
MSTAENLSVFKKTHKLTIKLYELTSSFPNKEKFGLTSQIRRAASSINANLMEGSHRSSDKEYKNFVNIAKGSSGELKYHLLLAKDLNYITNQDYLQFKNRINEVSKMLSGLINSLES